MREKKVAAIEFKLMSPDMIRKLSTVRVRIPDTYDDDGFPIENGLMDLRMGVIDPGLRCKTCGGNIHTCPGHFGHIELVRPVLHIGYIKTIYALLKATCSKCGRLLLPQEEIERYKNIILKEEKEEEEFDVTLTVLNKVKKVSKCPHCGAKQEQIRLEKPYLFFEGDQRLFPSEIRERLERIPDDDLLLLGINPRACRPEWMVLTVLPVPPPNARPTITLETGERSEDDLTHKLADLIRINQRLADNISSGAPQLIIEDLMDLLQYHVATYFNNELPNVQAAKHRSGRPLKSLFQRLKGKEGRFRYYLSGKRVNFSARTVISPDPSLSIEEVGVPRAIAEELTIPEKVTEWNIEKLKTLILRDEYPKANYVIRPDGRRKKVTPFNREELAQEIQPGYIVERQLIDGDIVVFNRQPSLHRMSMMAHRVKVLPGKTFRLNDAVAPPYNADYDGDEMNLHVPQNEEAQVEAEELLLPRNHIVSIGYSDVIISPTLDQVVGTYLLTRDETEFDKEIAAWILGSAGIRMTSGNRRIRGKEIFSELLPKDLNLVVKTKACLECGTCDKEKCPFQAYVKIENGVLKSGAIDSLALKRIIHYIFKFKGPKAAKEFIDKCVKISLHTLMIKGLSISVDDYNLSEKTQKRVREAIERGKKEAYELIRKYEKGELVAIPGKSLEDTLEDLVLQVLDRTRDRVATILDTHLDTLLPPLLIARCGAKGNIMNVTRIAGLIGQCAVRGKRIKRTYRTKVMPYFKGLDLSPEARGFVETPLRKGLNPLEIFFYAMSGRDSVVDKGINPSKSGYMYRRLSNALMDIYVELDKSVRDATGRVVQFKYGEDGVNPIYSTKEGLLDTGLDFVGE